MDLEIIYPQIYVFHNALTNTDEFINDITGSEEFVDPWHDWYTLGKQTLFKNYPGGITEQFPTLEQWQERYNSCNNSLAIKIANIFYETTKKFVEDNNILIPSWNHGSPTICSHFAKSKDNLLAMQYHTDFIMAKKENPGYKHWITCCIYINDDYDGGDLSFKIFKDDGSYDLVNYKPKAGDAVIFPSASPYFHGVKKARNKEKYFIRMFWGYDSEGSPEWLANQEKYGKEAWESMEEKRTKHEYDTSFWMRGFVEE